MNNGMETKGNDIDFDLIARHLSGETNPAEEERLVKWLESARENRRLYGEYKELWNKLDKVAPVASTDLDREWRLLESRIRGAGTGSSSPEYRGQQTADPVGRQPSTESLAGTSASAANAEERQLSREKPEGRQRSIAYLALRIAIAASVVFALGFLGLYLSRHVNRTFQSASSPQEFILQDGSAVTLNRNSRLTCPLNFRKDLREVSLQGEGFFEVEADPARPFLIHAGEIDVRVMGTSFNVSAYKSSDEVQVIVKSGKVAVSRTGDVPRTLLISPGTKAVYRKPAGELELSGEIDQNYLAWKTRNFIFDDRELGYVVNILNQVYGSDISIPSDTLRKERITTTFKGESLDAILNVLSATLDLKVVRSGDRIQLEGSK
jgi:transmembrane sensor